MKRFHLSLLAGVLVAGAANATILYQTDFETDQSSNFTVAISSADTEANFNYDYATWTPTAPTAGITAIGAAPGGAGTKGLKIRSNFDGTGTDEAVTAFVNASAGKSEWTLTFDAFQLWNGAADISGTGTTTGFTVGNANTSFPFHTVPATFNGWFLLMTGEGGSASDARYYSAASATPVASNATPVWLGVGAAQVGMPTAEWSVIFAAPNYPQAGTPGRQWVTWEVVSNGTTVTVSVTPVGGTKTQIASWTQTANQTAGIGFWDLFTGSVADPASDNFVVIDNLILEEPDPPPPPPASATNWSVYQ